MRDQYDEQIERLTKEPELIESEWFKGEGLFRMLGIGEYKLCLTMIKCGYYSTPAGLSEGIFMEIKADQRLPDRMENITVETLPVFAEWQRKLGKLNLEAK